MAASRAAFGYRSFRYYMAARFLVVCSSEMQAVGVAWQVYGLTHRPLDLGLVGLAQFVPSLLLFPVAGHAADRFPRKRIVQACYGGFALVSLLLAVFTMRGSASVYPVYGALLWNGVVRAFHGPAGQAILPQLVPAEDFPGAVAWASSIFQSALIAGPAIGGLIYGQARDALPVYVCAGAAYLSALVLMAGVKVPVVEMARPPVSTAAVLEGVRFIRNNQLILGALSLDLFAVLLGGATALLPVYARDILKVGASGLGLLRSAPGAGAVLMAVVLAHWPLRRRAGAAMLWCVAGFGLCTVVFGLSRSMALSLAALVLAGALDMVSVIVRHTTVQLNTPDGMRGRVSAVNTIFIGASNEVGQFESGLTAQWFGTVPAVVLGGLGTIAVVALWVRLFPALRRVEEVAAP